ncbi:MAG: NUDIX hydrolase [Candidatus Paceibacterota bacterium]
MNTPFAVAGFLYNPKNKSVFLHHRDGNTTFNPHKWAFFGGLGEAVETPLQAFVRELEEETNLSIKESEAISLRSYVNTDHQIMRHVFFVVSDIDISLLKLGEGAGFAWVSLSEIDTYDLTKKTREDLEYFLASFFVDK